jgi:hypothetical protein
MQEGMGRIVDRSKEMLVAAEFAVVTARRKLLDILKSPESLERFRALIRDGQAFAVQPLDTIASTGDVKAFLAENSLA